MMAANWAEPLDAKTAVPKADLSVEQKAAQMAASLAAHLVGPKVALMAVPTAEMSAHYLVDQTAEWRAG